MRLGSRRQWTITHVTPMVSTRSAHTERTAAARCSSIDAASRALERHTRLMPPMLGTTVTIRHMMTRSLTRSTQRLCACCRLFVAVGCAVRGHLVGEILGGAQVLNPPAAEERHFVAAACGNHTGHLLRVHGRMGGHGEHDAIVSQMPRVEIVSRPWGSRRPVSCRIARLCRTDRHAALGLSNPGASQGSNASGCIPMRRRPRSARQYAPHHRRPRTHDARAVCRHHRSTSCVPSRPPPSPWSCPPPFSHGCHDVCTTAGAPAAYPGHAVIRLRPEPRLCRVLLSTSPLSKPGCSRKIAALAFRAWRGHLA